MGNSLRCISHNDDDDGELGNRPSKYTLTALPLFTCFNGRTGLLSSFSSSSLRKEKKKKKKKNRRKDHHQRQHIELDADSFISEQAIAAALLFHNQHRNNGTNSNDNIPITRSTSVVYPSPALPKKQRFTRSSSARQQSNTDLFLQPHQLVNQELKMESLETRRFVLVHGGGFGAWCWYKTMTLLEENGFKVDVVDLTGSGVSSFDTNNITSLAQYVKPLTDIFNKLGNEEKVILVGHDFGGACISFVMELFPYKIAKAIFIAATMLTSGHSTLDLFSQQTGSNDLMQQGQIFLYANGKDNPPTSIDLDRTLLRDLMFNQSSAKDVALASVSMRTTPFAPVLEKLSLTDKNYGSIPRFYVKTLEDFAIPVSVQEAMINSNPPQQTKDLDFLVLEVIESMGRGVSAGGGQSSLGYLFGSGEAPKPASNAGQAVNDVAPSKPAAAAAPTASPAAAPAPSQPADIAKQVPAGINSTSTNNYMRADGQNTGNFITDRPSTKVHAAPGGGSSLGYLFGGGSN
ncbi:hypothetical protein LWI28_005298 [Acer negundo]|uniref:AB hydrolase-1 domain-containing protein n=1 Tax=Acer negundo TaxID=4023 RepID=A0AAD5ILL8_ACENE|nr:hypothetical protein LWI28_005298 [Acer negundo]